MKKIKKYNITQYYGRLLIKRLWYDKLKKQTENDILKFYRFYLEEELTTFDIRIDSLIKYYENLKKNDFMVEKQEIVIDLVEEYGRWFKLNREECKDKRTKEYYIMFKRLEELYMVLKPIKNDFKDIYFKIDSFRQHRLLRKVMIRNNIKRKPYKKRK